MSLTTFQKLLKEGLIVGDGAMATLLHQSGVPVRTSFESLCINRPELVQEAHLAYLKAGSTLIQTNTFSGHRAGLGRYNLEDKVWDINREAVKIAKQATEVYYHHTEIDPAEKPTFVFGTLGSTADIIKSPDFSNKGTRMSLRFLYEEQASALLEENVDGILLETFPNLEELQLAIETVRSLTEKPLIANLAPDTVGVTRDGYSIEEAFQVMQEDGADVVGLNCRLGLSGILRTYEKLKLKSDYHYAAVPNGGLLHLVDGNYSYTGNADYFADICKDLYYKGVHFIGGCCGTTPEHIHTFVKRMEGASNKLVMRDHHPNQILPAETQKPRLVEKITLRAELKGTSSSLTNHNIPIKETLLNRVKSEKTVIVELDPPKVLDVNKYFEAAQAINDAGADAITIADNSLGSVRVSNMAIASLLKKMNIESIVHVACRDRNLIGQQSHLMGLHVLDIHHILLVTGDPSRFGDLPGATSVFDVSSIELTRMVKKLNKGIAFSGQRLKQASHFKVGTSFNPHVPNFKKALDRLRRKLDAGADYVMTQPIYNQRIFEQIAKATEAYKIPIFVGIMPLTSARNAQFLHNEVPGIDIPPSLLERMNNTDQETASSEGIRIAEALINEAMNYFNGIYLVTPFLRYELTVQLTQYILQRSSKSIVGHFE